MTQHDRKLTLDDIPQEPQIRRSMFDYVARALGELGSGVDPSSEQSTSRSDPDAFVPFRRFAQLLEDAAHERGDPCLGLRIGLSTDPKETGALGFVLVNSPTFGAAIDNLGRYLGLHQTGAEISARLDDGRWRIAYRVLHPALAGFHQDAECTIGMLIAGTTSLSNVDLSGLEVHFRRSAALHADAFQEALLGTTIRFDQPADAVFVPAEIAERPITGADEDLLHILEQHAELLLEQAPSEDEVHSRVERAVERSLRGGPPRLADVARRLGMGERTLQRRLRERDLTFHDVVDQVRERFARQSVAEDDVTLTEVAFLLGYSESSAFVRAFRRWTGKTPLAYRKHAQR